ncbi:SDR family NAD(P)-dependent oxidoreductase, partial [Niastella yeongjuensis]
ENKELKDWVYYPSWKRLLAAGSQPAGKRSFLVFCNNVLFSQRLKEQLLAERVEDKVIEVGIAEEYRRYTQYQYALNPSSAREYDLLLADLSAAGIIVTDIVYAWGPGAEQHSFELQKDNTQLGRVYFGLVYLVQSLLRAGMLKEKRITVLTEGLHKVLGTETGGYHQSLLLGLVNVLPQEYSVTCFNIDLLPSEPLDQWISQLTAEIRRQEGRKERIVALRHGQRWVQDFQKNTQEIKSTPGKIKRGGVYLITGGLGNVGFVLGKYLLQHYGATLVLTGRKEAGMLNKEALSHYNELRKISESVYYYQADVADLLSMQQVAADATQKTGRIDGVIHAAGIIDDHYFELIEDITPAKALVMLAPKVKGIENIYQVFRERNPDFIWVTSSLSTVLGGLGFSSYAAANLYMEYFVLSKAREMPGWRSIGLGDMVFSDKQIQKENGPSRSCLKPDEITVLFEWSVGFTGAPVIIQTVEELWARVRRVYELKKEAYLDEDRDKPTELVKMERPQLTSTYKAPQTETEKRMSALYENFFGIDGIGTEDNFFELGGDSLKAMMLLKRIKNEFDINITLTDFFNHDRVGSMAAFADQIRSIAVTGKKASRKIVI